MWVNHNKTSATLNVGVHPMKPSLFIGCSAESLDFAYALQECLEHDAESTVWDQGIFVPSSYTLDALSTALEDVDFAAFIFAPDDIVLIREQEQVAVRDNVVFEMGLSVGKLGRERSFVLLPKTMTDFRLPSDLLGLTPTPFSTDRKDANLVAALGPAANKIRKAMRRFGTFGTAQGVTEGQITQVENETNVAPTPDSPGRVEDSEIPSSLSPEEREAFRQIIASERARAALWEYRFLSYFLVPTTQRVLDWLAALPNPITYGLFNAFWSAFILELAERQAILRALESHYLIAWEGELLRITEKGLEYVVWRGPLPAAQPPQSAEAPTTASSAT